MIDKKERLSEIIELVRNIPVSNVIETRIVVYRKHGSALAYCPFHADNSLGSFVITDNKGIWKCFSCGVGGDGPKFIAMFDNIPYIKAALKIALEFNLIVEAEMKSLTRNSKSYHINELSLKDRKDFELETPRSDEKTLHFVYSLMKKGLALEDVKNGPLSATHKKYLHNRNINDKQIEKNEYFTFPSRKAMKQILIALEKRNLDVKTLIGVPGFYLNKKTNKITFCTTKGIGIPIYNENKKIVGIQIRRDEIKDNQQRYIWFSSSFTAMSDDADLGTSQGAPINVIFPDEIKSSTLFITEGHFKADELASRYSSCALSVQGVGNWKGIENVIQKMTTYYEPLKFIYIAFDADMAQNINVAMQAIKMSSFIRLKFPKIKIFYMLWDENKGKGIDDLLFSENGESEIFKISQIRFDEAYNNYLMLLMKKFNVTSTSLISIEMMKKFGREQAKENLEAGYIQKVFNPLKEYAKSKKNK